MVFLPLRAGQRGAEDEWHACMHEQVSPQGALVVAGAATAANLFESYLGAAVQGRVEWLSNDAINMVQICVAAGLAIAVRQTLL